MAASAYNSVPEVVATLLQAGADFNSRTKDGWTALMVAAARSTNPEVVSILLNAGVNINAKDKDGLTALMRAEENEDPQAKAEIVKLLQDMGAAK